jgi:hypothetical protein
MEALKAAPMYGMPYLPEGRCAGRGRADARDGRTAMVEAGSVHGLVARAINCTNLLPPNKRDRPAHALHLPCWRDPIGHASHVDGSGATVIPSWWLRAIDCKTLGISEPVTDLEGSRLRRRDRSSTLRKTLDQMKIKLAGRAPAFDAGGIAGRNYL